MYDAAMHPAEDEEASAQPDNLAQRFLGSMLWRNTEATARRFFYSMALLVPAVLPGLHMGLFPYIGSFFPALHFLSQKASSWWKRLPCNYRHQNKAVRKDDPSVGRSSFELVRA